MTTLLPQELIKDYVDLERRILTQTVTDGDASIDLDGVFRLGYNYKIKYEGIEFNSAATPFLRLSDDGGATWKNGASDYGWKQIYGVTGIAGQRDTADTEIDMSAYNQIVTSLAYYNIEIFDPMKNAETFVMGLTNVVQGASSQADCYFQGRLWGAFEVDSLQVIPSTGTVKAGTVSVYEIKA